MFTKFTGIAKKLPSPLYKLAAQAYIDETFPRHIFIETTAACQLSCSYCPREKRTDHMDFNLFKRIVDECNEHGPRSFSLHLFGEPLLYPFILEAIRYIKSKDRRHTILLTTNGLLLNKFADSILELGVDRIIWSWRRNNFTPHTIEILKKIGMVRLLIEETPKEEFEKWKTFPRVEIKHLHNYGGNIDVSKWGIDDSNSNIDRMSTIGMRRYPCYHLWLAPAIRWNGEIVRCCDDPHGKSSVGVYSASNSLYNYWNSSVLKVVRDNQMKGVYEGICKDCNVWKTYPDIFFQFQKKNGHPK